MATGNDNYGMHCEGLTYWDYYSLPGWPGGYVQFKRFRIWDQWDTSGQFNGAGGVRWNQIHTASNIYQWDHLDAILASLGTKGIAKADTMYTFGGVPEWLSGSSDPAVPFDVTDSAKLAEWESFVWELASRASGDIGIWGLWNEPNAWPYDTGGFWKGTPAELYELAYRAYQIIKDVDPTAIVVSPEIEGNGGGWLSEYFAAGGDWCQDRIGVHYYDILNFRAFHDGVLAACNTADVSLPFMLSEWGFGGLGGSDVNGPSYIAKGLLYAASYGFETSIWYSPEDGATGTMVTFNANGEPNGSNGQAAAWNRIRDKWLTAGRSVAAPVFTGTNENRKEITITGPNGYEALAIWNDAGSGTKTVTAGKWKQYRLPGSNTKTIVSSTASSIGFNQTPRLYENQATA